MLWAVLAFLAIVTDFAFARDHMSLDDDWFDEFTINRDMES